MPTNSTTPPSLILPILTHVSPLHLSLGLLSLLLLLPPTSAPEYFDATTVARDLGDNWALKSSNLRKLLRNLETYYHNDLNKTTDLFATIDVSAIAKESDADGIANLVELVAAAAVQCDNRAEIVPRIMNMSPAGQVEMKGVIESSMGRLQDRGGDDDGDYDDGSAGGVGSGEPGIEFDSDDYDSDGDGGGDPSTSMSAMFSAAEHDIDAAMADLDGETAAMSGPRAVAAAAGAAELVKERDELRASLQDARRELAAHKSQASIMAEEQESAERKLRALAEDLQERLGRRQEELSAAEEDLSRTRRAREDAEAKVADLQEKCATLADELDVASAKASQLAKAEATVVAYRKRLEAAGSMNQQMTEMENQAEGYLRQIMELEADAKKLPGLQNTVEDLQNKVTKFEKERLAAEDDVRSKTTEVTKLKGELASAESAKKMFEEELTTLKAQQEHSAMDDLTNDVSGMSMTSAKSVAEAKEKALRLEIENKKLKEEMEEMQTKQAAELAQATAEAEAAAAAAAAAAASNSSAEAAAAAPAVSSLELARLKGRIAQLEKDLKQKEAEKAKLGSDKEKLEAYTKKTLSKFQEKYLVALQECKAKLKEKHDKIEALEMRSASEKTAQKREERLLSSTIYELGLAIMQQRLKER